VTYIISTLGFLKLTAARFWIFDFVLLMNEVLQYVNKNAIGVGVVAPKATGRNTGGISGFGGNIPEIEAASGGNSVSLKDL
jgi:hypothetical protein